MTPLKCPNPRCTFLFDPSTVPAGATLACPMCQMKFNLGNAAPATPKTTPSQPETIEEAEPSWLMQNLLKIVGGLVGLSLLLIIVILLTRGGGGDNKRFGAEQRVETYNFSLTPPIGSWSADDNTKNNILAVNVAAFKREDPEAYTAFAARNYDTRNAKPGEIREYINDRVNKLFDNLHIDEVPNATWLGTSAVKIQFRGTAKVGDAIYAGEAMGVSVKGTAYWFFAWAPEKDVSKVADEFVKISAQLKLLNTRDNWVETAPVSNAILGPGYKLLDTESIWKTKPDPKDEDANATLLCVGTYKPKGKTLDIKPTADLVGFTLDAKGTPLETARKYVEERYNRDAATFGKATFEEVRDAPMGDKPPGEIKTEGVIRLKLTRPNSPTSTRLIVINAVASGTKVAVVEANCGWAERFIWENRLIGIVGTLTGS